MSTDIRIQAALRHHPKWIRLRSRLGVHGQMALVYLWLFTAEVRPKGGLNSISDSELLEAAGWGKRKGDLLGTLCELGWLDKDADGWRVHDWEANNPWAFKSEDRQKVARENAYKRWNKMRGSRANGNADGNASGNTNGNAPLPSPPLLRGRGGETDALPPSPQAGRSLVLCAQEGCSFVAAFGPGTGAPMQSMKAPLCAAHYRSAVYGPATDPATPPGARIPS